MELNLYAFVWLICVGDVNSAVTFDADAYAKFHDVYSEHDEAREVICITGRSYHLGSGKHYLLPFNPVMYFNA